MLILKYSYALHRVLYINFLYGDIEIHAFELRVEIGNLSVWWSSQLLATLWYLWERPEKFSPKRDSNPDRCDSIEFQAFFASTFPWCVCVFFLAQKSVGGRVFFGSETCRNNTYRIQFVILPSVPSNQTKNCTIVYFVKTKGQFLEDSKFMNTKNYLYTQSYFFFWPVKDYAIVHLVNTKRRLLPWWHDTHESLAFYVVYMLSITAYNHASLVFMLQLFSFRAYRQNN